jgi:hypothetical protein
MLVAAFLLLSSALDMVLEARRLFGDTQACSDIRFLVLRALRRRSARRLYNDRIEQIAASNSHWATQFRFRGLRV